MKGCRFGIVTAMAVVLAPLASLLADGPQPTATMKDVVDGLRSAPVTAPETMYFEMLNQNTVIGIIVATLKPTKNDPPGLEYRVETMMKMPNGIRLKGLATAQLTSAFEPESIELNRELQAPDGQKQDIVDRVQVREKDLVLVHAEGGVASLPRSIPRPAGPFAFGMEFLVPRVDTKKHPIFELRELNPQSGEIIEHTFETEGKPDGSRIVRSRRADGSVGYLFAIDATGKLQSWNESQVAVLTRRCSENRIAELRIQLAK